jgi:hypothetical protein
MFPSSYYEKIIDVYNYRKPDINFYKNYGGTNKTICNSVEFHNLLLHKNNRTENKIKYRIKITVNTKGEVLLEEQYLSILNPYNKILYRNNDENNVPFNDITIEILYNIISNYIDRYYRSESNLQLRYSILDDNNIQEILFYREINNVILLNKQFHYYQNNIKKLIDIIQNNITDKHNEIIIDTEKELNILYDNDVKTKEYIEKVEKLLYSHIKEYDNIETKLDYMFDTQDEINKIIDNKIKTIVDLYEKHECVDINRFNELNEPINEVVNVNKIIYVKGKYNIIQDIIKVIIMFYIIYYII